MASPFISRGHGTKSAKETKNYVAIASEFQAMAHLPDVNNAKIFEPEPGIVYSWELDMAAFLTWQRVVAAQAGTEAACAWLLSREI